MKAGLVILCALVVAAGAAAAGGPSVKLTSAGNARATAALLKLSDLGEGWNATVTKTAPPVLTCRGHAPSFAGVVENGVATSPTFAATPTGPFIQQQTSAYVSAAQAAATWRRAVTPALSSCAVQTIESLVAKGITVKIASRKTLKIAKSTPHVVGYRIVATLTSKTQKLKDYFDVIYVSRGHALSSIAFSSFTKPLPAVVENAIAKVVAARSS